MTKDISLKMRVATVNSGVYMVHVSSKRLLDHLITCAVALGARVIHLEERQVKNG